MLEQSMYLFLIAMVFYAIAVLFQANNIKRMLRGDDLWIYPIILSYICAFCCIVFSVGSFFIYLFK
jgi:hypothetical protein